MYESQDNLKVTLHEIAAEGKRDEAKKLIDSGKDPNEQDDLGWTPLMHAVRNGHCNLARDFLSQGANACLLNHHGVTVFTIAVLRCDEDLLEKLYKSIEPLELRQVESNNALQVACVRGLYTAARWLLVNTSAQINAISPITGVTPLLLTVIEHHYRLTDLLLGFGADTTITSRLGQNVFHLSVINGDKKLYRLLHHDDSPTELACFDFKKITQSEFEPIDPQYKPNNIYLDIHDKEMILKASPNRPVFKTCSDSELDRYEEMGPMLTPGLKSVFVPSPEVGSMLSPSLRSVFLPSPEVDSMLSPSLKSVFLPSPQLCSSAYSQSWDNSMHGEHNLCGLISPRFEHSLSTSNSPSNLPNRGRKRKLSNKISCSSWLKRLTKRRTRSVEDTDDSIDFDSFKQNSIDFTQLLFSFGLDDFLPIFKEQELDMWTFLSLTADDLDSMGIHDGASQARILKSVEMLRKTHI